MHHLFAIGCDRLAWARLLVRGLDFVHSQMTEASRKSTGTRYLVLGTNYGGTTQQLNTVKYFIINCPFLTVISESVLVVCGW